LVDPVYKKQNNYIHISAILTAASAAIPAGLTYKYGWGASPMTPGVNKHPEKSYMEWNYYKPWCRFSPYIVGIFLGYLLHITKSKPFKMSKVANLWGWTIAAATGMAIVYGLDIPSGRSLSMAENIIYGGFHRLAWAIAVSWVIFACSRGYGGLLILLLVEDRVSFSWIQIQAYFIIARENISK
jgi:hypothetical protein